MSGETQKVDVLAVMADAEKCGPCIHYTNERTFKAHSVELREARAALAELIDATAFLSAELIRKYGGSAAVGESRVRAALARVGGVA